MDERTTKAALLDAAQVFVQTRGYNAFSYRDLARHIGIRTPSIHYHFPTKGDLGRDLMSRYREQFLSLLADIDRGERDPRRKVKRFIELFRLTLKSGDRLCLCGMLATEYATLPAPVQKEVRRFFRDSEAWLAKVLAEGRSAKIFRFRGPVATSARTLFAALEGAMISARTFGEEERLTSAGRWMLEALKAAP
jgi:TetR/AcrR family transcriptional repressor of nem operon